MEDSAFQTLDSERLVIRRFRDVDAKVFAAYRDDPDVSRYQGWDRPYSDSQAMDFISLLQGLSPGRTGTWFQFAIGLRDSNRLIGDVGLRTTDDHPPQGELGFSLAVSHQGHGYAAEAVRRVIASSFSTLGMSRLFAATEGENVRARRLLSLLEFQLVHQLGDGVCVYEKTGPMG
jgi:RimJ/RimL family protein N-acetyltransferase